MGRRKIEIKAIKDDRNRSVTFLKRKGGLFKKAHELSVLCSVDVAVFIFGNNKKLYEYSSTDMRELIHRYQYHGGPSEHKGPSDFNGGNDDDEDEENDGTPPHGPEVVENQMMPPHAYGQHQPPFPQIRHHTPSASPPIGNGGPFQAHPGHPIQRQHTPQPSIGSRPASRTDMRRMGPGMSSLVLPPPSPSASAILSAGATGPPNPFARPPPQQNVNGDTPVSALPSRFLTNELLPSPSSFYPDWNFRGGDSNTLPSPLNFATPVVGSGPSFLRDDLNTTPNANSNVSKDRDPLTGANGSLGQNLSVAPNNSTATKRKTPEPGATTQSDTADESEPKRLKVDE
ncbi:putative RLM1-transcription factor of the MADS box family [Fusarium fujikuroi]|nr:putative RLM1-transcription factor of the MADS box family [Fusarium fujikuroi]